MAALRSFKIIYGPLQLLLLLLLQDLVEPYHPQIQGPEGRKITAGSLASFKCSASGPSEDVQVNWIKDGERIQPTNQTKISSSVVKKGTAYSVTSNLAIQLGQGDIRSKLTCQILQNSTQKAQTSFSLTDVLRVPPKVLLETIPPSPVQLNASVMVICKAESFYPDIVKVELFHKDAPRRKGIVGPSALKRDGRASRKSYLEEMATEDKNSSLYLCQVEHDSQPLIIEATRLFITRQLQTSENFEKQSIIVLCISIFLTKVAILLFIFCLFLITVCGHNRTSSRSGTTQKVKQSGTSS